MARSKQSFAAKGSEENLATRRRGRRVAGVRGRRIGHRADRACTSAGHTASRHHAQRGGNLRRQPGDVLCLRQGKRRVRRTRATCSPRLWRLRLQGLRSARSRLRRLRRLPRLPRLRGAILWLWRLRLWRLRLRLPGVDRPDLGLDLLAGHKPVKGRRRKGARSRLPRSHLPPHPRHRFRSQCSPTSGRSHSWQNRNRRRFHSDGGGDVTPSTSRQEPGPTRSQVIGSLERAANNVR